MKKKNTLIFFFWKFRIIRKVFKFHACFPGLTTNNYVKIMYISQIITFPKYCIRKQKQREDSFGNTLITDKPE